jgi:hypothetical protein
MQPKLRCISCGVDGTPRDLQKDVGAFLSVVAIVILSLFAAPGYAQVAGATLSGTVTDPSSAVISGAQVSIKDVSTGVSRAVKTDAVGLYTAPNLLPGTYEITTMALGFEVEVRTGVVLTVGAQQVLNFTLRVGQSPQQIKVTGGAPAIELASSTLSNVVTADTVRELPLNGRDWTMLATLHPGISSAGSIQQPVSAGFNRGNRGYGTQLTVAGARPVQNNYRVDGVSVNDYANGGPGSVLGRSVGVDAIQEFSVLSSNYSAEYGRTSGGVVNAITRSGANNIHGDAYEFLRNSALDAATFVDNAGGVPKPPFRQNQFGAAVGGAIRKNHTFFFGDYEGIRQSVGLTYLDIVPSADARNGIIHNADGTTCTIGIASSGCALTNSAGTVGVDPAVKPFLAFWPLPNGNLIAPGNTGNFAVSTQQLAHENFVTGRIDHKISDKDSIFGSYQYDQGLFDAPDNLNTVVNGNNTFRQLVSLEETRVVSTQWINNVRFGFNRVAAQNAYSGRAINPLETDKSLSAVPGQNPPGVTVTGLTPVYGGLNSRQRYEYYWNSFQSYDDAFLTAGKHGVKFGIGVERIDLNDEAFGNAGGNFSYGSLTGFLTNSGTGASFTAQFPGSNTPRGIRQTIFGAYLQDDIRWRPNLTLNLGVRYEMATVPTEVQGKIANLYNLTDPLPTCEKVYPGCASTPGPVWSNPTLRNFEPRVGFAWDPFHSGKTSVRGGFGIFDVLPLPYETLIGFTQSAPFLETGNISPIPNGAFPSEAFPFLKAASNVRTEYTERNPKRNYVMQWNLTVQRQLLPSLTFMLGYVGSRGVHMTFRADDINSVPPTLTPRGYIWPCGGTFTAAGLCTNPGSGTVLNPNIGRMDPLIWNENAFYHDLEVQITKKMSHGLRIQAAYTWGKAIDEGSSGVSSDFQNSINSPPVPFAPRLSRGVSDFNIAQKLVINATWLIPTPKSLHGPAAWVVGGWEMGEIYTAQTGLPFTPRLGGDPLGLKSSAPSDFPDRLYGSGCQSAVNPGNVDNYLKLQCFTFPNPSTLLGNEGRNTVNGPGLMNLDFSLFKNNYIRKVTGTFNVQFRAEFFNALNSANFLPPTDRQTVFDDKENRVAGSGRLDQLSTPAREIQFALKVIW